MIEAPAGHRPRKRFGQNFLQDTTVIDRIVDAVAPAQTQHLVEIGPGQGALTGALVASGCRLDVIELDRDLVPALRAAYSQYPRFRLHSADALNFDFHSLLGTAPAQGGQRLRIVGNLPYNIATELIFRLLTQIDIIRDMHFMLQLEVVERLAASPGNKNWGRLGIMVQYHCAVEHLFDVPPEAFRPQPRVRSAIVRLVPREQAPWPPCDKALLDTVVRAAFAQRRKTLRNNLKALIDSSRIEALGIDPAARAESLTLAQFIDMANALNA